MMVPQKRKAESLLDIADGPMLTVVVSKKKFYAPWKILARHSSYFQALMNPNFEESGTKTVSLDDVEEDTFRRFLSWIYFGKLYDEKTTPVDPKATEKEDRTAVNISQLQLCKLWTFADMRGIPALQNGVLRHLKKRIDESWSVDISAMQYVWDNTMPNAKLRVFMVELTALTTPWTETRSVTTACRKGWEANVMVDLLARVCEYTRTGKTVPIGRDAWKEIDISRFLVP